MAEEQKLTLSDAKERLEGMKTRLKNLASKADEYIEYSMNTAVSMGVAGALGAVEGYNKEEFKLGGADGAAVVSVALHAMALMGDSRYSPQIGAAAQGAGAVWAFKAGSRIGKRMRENKDAGKPIISGGDDDPQELGAGNVRHTYGSVGITPYSRAAE